METQERKPSAPKAVKVPPPNEEMVDKEIQELFDRGKKPTAEEPTHDQFDTFIRSTARSKIAVIIPMYGYWADVHVENVETGQEEPGFLDHEVLRPVMNRVSSASHSMYAIIVAEPERLSRKVYDTLQGRYVGSNLECVRVPVGSSYSEYVAEGIRVALAETDAQYLIVYNPWGVIQAHGVDTLVDRVNLNGNAPVICGYDVHTEVKPQSFDLYKAAAPREFASYRAKHLLSFDFIGMKRFIAEMCTVDPRFKTQPFAERDFFQQVAQQGFDAVTSERVPVFFFQVPWEQYVPDEWYAEDLAEFQSKWHFTPADIRIPKKHE